MKNDQKVIKFWTYVLIYIFCRSLFAQSIPVSSTRNLPVLSQQGQLVSVRIEPGQPVRIFVVGREEAQIPASSLKLVVWRLTPGPKEIMTLKKVDDHYILEPEKTGSPTQIEIRAGINDKSEKFIFKLNPQLH